MMTFEPPEFVKILGLPMAGAFLGTVARSQKWRYPDDLKLADGTADKRAGRWNWTRMVTECVSAPAIGMMVAGVCQAFHLEAMVGGGLGAALAIVGAPALGEIVERGLRQKVDALTAGGAK